MRVEPQFDRLQQILVHHEQGGAERHVGRPECRHGNGADQKDRGQDGEDALNDHMNSFSPFSPSYKEDTNSPYPL